jgi:curved DNA-binding protein CbpA
VKDFYYILGVDENSSADVIKDAYRKLSKKFHPDMNIGDKYFESRFREVQEAYEVLSDPSKRKRYNAALRDFRSQEPVIEIKKQRSSTKSIDIFFTIILLALTLILGDYVMKAMNDHPKPKVASKFVSDSLIAYTAPVKHHKKHHKLKAVNYSPDQTVNSTVAAANTSAKPIVKTAAHPIPKLSAPMVQPIPKPTIVSAQATPKTIAHPVQPVDESLKAAEANNYLYAAHIMSNVTGKTNLREEDKFGSDVIGTIPDNTEVFVLEKGKAYYRILYNHQIGYVPKWALDKK